ncbi:MAG: hypothetical protein R3305_02475, partial [Gammaproteobacteria bacterium]|nr:hypothetical protein [Gammaproteobacteria bacterium]
LDPYQDVFNEIANDLAAAREELSRDEVEDIRTVAELRYAEEITPEAFAGYVEQENDGSYEIVRLPAINDPMLQRTRTIRQREQLFLETLDQHYDRFSNDISQSYDGWREYSREDSIALQEAARAAKMRTGLGALTILLSIAYGNNSDNTLADRIIRDAGFYIGSDMLRSAATRRQERRLHQQSLRELSESFDDDVKPMVIEIQGTTHRLTGTTDRQFEEWRGLLREMFISETGFVPDDIEVYIEPDAEAEAEAAAPSDTASTPTAEAEAQEAAPDESGGPVSGA